MPRRALVLKSQNDVGRPCPGVEVLELTLHDYIYLVMRVREKQRSRGIIDKWMVDMALTRRRITGNSQVRLKHNDT